jgi:peptidoglycan/LPS O-acetylase OafA/YrhL
MTAPQVSTIPALPNPSIAATVHLDAVRGAAALAVVAYHIRYKFFLDYSEVHSSDLLTHGFYAATSFGHDAVMVFFVLSGYLITGTVLKDVRTDRWSWGRYLLNRLTRLYVVLIPGLLLTVGWDLLGLHLFPAHPAYTGMPQAWTHDFFDVRETLTPAIFFANATFRHAISGISALGSNSPLWSLTYEFAYYMVFPAALLATVPRIAIVPRVVFAAMAILLAYHFGPRILLYFPIWLLGLAVKVLPPLPRVRDGLMQMRNVGAAVLVVGLTAFRHTSMFERLAGKVVLEAGDFLVGLAFAFALAVLLADTRPARPGFYLRMARGSAHISYTLYVVHMPLLIFLRAWLNDGPQWSPAAGTWLAAAGVFAAAVGYAAVLWYCFEARTASIRDAVSHRLAAFRSFTSRPVPE